MSAVVSATAALRSQQALLPSPAPRRHEEADLQHSIMQFLDWALPDDAIAHHSPGEGKRTRRAQGELKRSGYKTGWPDIEVIWRGRSYFVELKARRGVMSPPQRSMLQKLVYCGCPVLLCRSADEVEARLRECGVPLRGRVAA